MILCRFKNLLTRTVLYETVVRINYINRINDINRESSRQGPRSAYPKQRKQILPLRGFEQLV